MASRGIGRAIAFAAHGARVVADYATNREAADEVVKIITNAGGVTHAIEMGPGNVLTVCVKRTIKLVKPLTVGTLAQSRVAAEALAL